MESVEEQSNFKIIVKNFEKFQKCVYFNKPLRRGGRRGWDKTHWINHLAKKNTFFSSKEKKDEQNMNDRCRVNFFEYRKSEECVLVKNVL